jgi:hypothetical protein
MIDENDEDVYQKACGREQVSWTLISGKFVDFLACIRNFIA